MTSRGNPYTNGSVRNARAVPAVVALVLLAACGGDTQVEGGGIETGPTAPTATGPTATGPTAETAETDPFAGPVELDLSARQNPTGAAMYSCDGIEGTWTYDPGELPVQGVDISVEAEPVDMSGGTGTLVITVEVTIPGAGGGTGVSSVDLTVVGTAEAPAIAASGTQVDASGAIEGIGFSFGDFFPENVEIPIVAGSTHC